MPSSKGGHYQPRWVPLDLRRELDTLIDTVAVLAADKGLALDRRIDATVPPLLMTDQRAWRAIVSNLLTNAIKFTEQGRITVRLTIQADQLCLSVTDSGRGIPPHRLTGIFQPFEQIDGGLNRRFGGSGLGLSIVQGYCDRLGGRVEVDSEPGRGSVFTVRLPLRPLSEPVATPLRLPAPALSTSVNDTTLTGQRVLVVEDFEINREIMVMQLQRHGAIVLEAADGDQAVILAIHPPVALILMDIQMPGKDGITAIREIRQYPGGRTLPIIGFTASADPPTHRQILAAGADRVLTKPIGEAELIKAVHDQLASVSV